MIALSVFEDLSQKLVLNQVELLEGGLEGVSIIAGRGAHVIGQAVGGVVHQHLGVLQAFGVVGKAEVDELGVVLDALERGAGVVRVTREHLLSSDLGDGMNEFGVKEALFARTGLLCAELELRQRLLVRKDLIYRRGAYGR